MQDAEGQRFLMVKRVGDVPAPDQITIVTKWFGDSPKRVPVA
jgi:hypothetical protein